MVEKDGEIKISISGGIPKYHIEVFDDVGNLIIDENDITIDDLDEDGTITLSGISSGKFRVKVGDLVSENVAQEEDPSYKLLAYNIIENVLINSPSPIEVKTDDLIIQQPTCYEIEKADGMISFGVKGGYLGELPDGLSYKYQIISESLPFGYQDIQIKSYGEMVRFESLPEGDYKVLVSVLESSGCEFSFTYTLIAPDILQSFHISKNISCKGENDGSIELSLIGGVPPYNIQLLDEFEKELDSDSPVPGEYKGVISLEEESLSFEYFGLPSGIYKIKIYDGSCEPIITNRINIREVEEEFIVIPESISVTPVSCNGDATGQFSLEVEGGWGNYHYSLDGEEYLPFNQTNKLYLRDLEVRQYTLYLSDERPEQEGCLLTQVFDIEQPPPLRMRTLQNMM